MLGWILLWQLSWSKDYTWRLGRGPDRYPFFFVTLDSREIDLYIVFNQDYGAKNLCFFSWSSGIVLTDEVSKELSVFEVKQ